jgi:hypothetical protein
MTMANRVLMVADDYRKADGTLGLVSAAPTLTLYL